MSFTHPTPAVRPASVVPSPALRPVYSDTSRQPRRTALTRRYEISWLDQSGEVQCGTRLAPATAAFEEAFSAFARGTLIATEGGLVAVEDLVPGMRLLTVEGRSETLVWTGTILLYPASAVPEIAPPALTRITGDTFGQGRPMPDLLLGPQARLLVRNPRCRTFIGTETGYVPARAFVDGDSVVSVSPVAPMSVCHLMLARQGTIRAAGIEVESYHPGAGFGEIIDPQMAGIFLSLFPQVSGFGDFGPPAHPRMTVAEAEQMLGV